MLLEKLVLSDIGAFGGRHEFDLAPRVKYGAKRPVVLFGGLNGAGKTTLMNAVRVVLYGRQAMDLPGSQKDYEAFLRDRIHKPRHSLVKPTSASVSLEFNYARLGTRTLYRVVRFWQLKGAGIEETLHIYSNGERISDFSTEQAQSFLNQLIPPGISQFFFFDGEKIASLASDDEDGALADSMRRLLGLDLADRLNTDLTLFLRQARVEKLDSRQQAEVSATERELSAVQEEISKQKADLYERIEPALDAAKERLAAKRTDLLDRGGAWAVNRGQLESELANVLESRRELESTIREELNGVAPFALAKSYGNSVTKSLLEQRSELQRRAAGALVEDRLGALKERLREAIQDKSVRRVVEGELTVWLANSFATERGASLGHNISAADAEVVLSAFSTRVPAAATALTSMVARAKALSEQEDSIRDKLVHAPSEESLKDTFEAISVAAAEVGTLEQIKRERIEFLRSRLWAAVTLTRRVRKLEQDVKQQRDQSSAEVLGERLQSLIEVFRERGAVAKCELLKRHFIASFQRLARKGDLVHSVRVDPRTFELTLLDKNGHAVLKKHLSAGEKQIYAIAMLEALAKTSGRNLPVIVDTPLGRLDSKHRAKLVESYFPVASHQVIVLSTDTEVDEAFYAKLSPHISHVYHLQFDEEAGSSNAAEGYFWRQMKEEAMHAP